MALTKVTTKGITDNAVDGDKLAPGSVTTAKIGASAVESSEINDGTVTASDLASTLDLSPKSVTLAGSTVEALKRPVQDNIALLGFKMAVNDGLTVFNLVDGVVDEFHDESGTDEGEGSNDNYCATNDLYQNTTCSAISAGFALTSVTEPQTSTAGGNPAQGVGTAGSFTVPAGMTSANLFVWGSGGAGKSSATNPSAKGRGGGGGYAEGTLAVTATQSLTITIGEGGSTGSGASYRNTSGAGGYRPSPASISCQPTSAGGGDGTLGGGGLSGVSTGALSGGAPVAVVIAGAGGGANGHGTNWECNNGGAGGGTTGDAGDTTTEQTGNTPGGATQSASGGGGDQEQGGQAGSGSCGGSITAQTGGLFYGGNGGSYQPGERAGAAGGAGYYGGGGGAWPTPFQDGAGGGGSSFHGHPQVTSGSTEEGAAVEGGGAAQPNYVACTNEGGFGPGTQNGEPGYVLITGTAQVNGGSSTIVSTAFTASSVPTSARIVVFEEDVQTPTLNTDVIASISRDGGSNFTTATLSDSGYVTGSSGQRILTGQATISGQPSGQSMRWKLALANNTVKIHGVALQWA